MPAMSARAAQQPQPAPPPALASRPDNVFKIGGAFRWRDTAHMPLLSSMLRYKILADALTQEVLPDRVAPRTVELHQPTCANKLDSSSDGSILEALNVIGPAAQRIASLVQVVIAVVDASHT